MAYTLSKIEFTGILLGSTLPLHSYLTDHPSLSLRLIVDGKICGETPPVNGDLTSGIWDINSSLRADSVVQSVTLAVVASKKGLKIRFASMKFSVVELLTRVNTESGGYQGFTIVDSSSSILFLMTCVVKALPSFIADNPFSSAVVYSNQAIDARGGEGQSSNSKRLSRDDLESFYAMAIRIPDQDDDKARALNALGCTYYALYEEEWGRADLDKAISLHEEAMQFTGPFHPQLAKHEHHLTLALMERCMQSGDPVDIEGAISHCENALRFTDDLDENKPVHLNNLGIAHRQRFERLGDPADLEKSISCQRQAIELTPGGHPNKPTLLNNFGTSLQSRFERLGSLADVEDAISSLRNAVDLTPDGHPDKPSRLNNLGTALLHRFGRLSSISDIEDAISGLQNAVDLTPDGHPDKPVQLSNLGGALQGRFERLGGLSDIEDAISSLRNAVDLTLDGHPDKPGRLSNLGNALQSRFQRLGSPSDIEDAISELQRAVDLTPDGHPDKPGQLNILGSALRFRFMCLDSLADMEGAISELRRSVDLTPDSHPEKQRRLTNLGHALQCRFERLDSPSDIEDAISELRKAVDLTPDGHPDGPGCLSNLGDGFLVRFRRLGIFSDLESALSAFSTAAKSTSGWAMVRFRAARRWADTAEELSRSPLNALSCAIELLPRIAWLGLAVTDQHALLADVGGVVRDAVAAAIRYEEYETAVVWAEQGRSIVWQNLLGLRSPVDNLHKAHPRLANRLQELARQLEGSVLPDTLVEDVSRGYSKLAVEWDTLIDKIRELPNFEGFLKAKSFSQLAPAAHEGPVVILNVNKSQCDALVLSADDSSERHVSAVNIPLERFSYKTSEKLFKALTGLLKSAGVRERSERTIIIGGSQLDREAKFKTILRMLWQDLVKPVIEGLAFHTGSKRPPRIWWCATGLLAFLPIHAAGLYDTQDIGEKVSDYVISSYTPTLTAILELPEPAVQDFQVLMVAQPSTPGAPPIPKTEDEVRLVHHLTAGARRMSLMNENATVERVREEMKESNWIHLACHGHQHPQDPMESGFLLHNETLKLSDIVKMSLPKADFAFLSACQTAVGDEKVAEESVHLAAGMFLSGCRGVVATTWSIRDDDAPKIAEDVYSRIFKDGKPNRKEAAYALQEAVKRLRESGAQCTSWVPFIHIGR